MHPGSLPRRHGAERGFTYVLLLTAVAVLGATLASLGDSWRESARRSKELELLWTGAAYVTAIESYYNASPGERRYPPQLHDLLDDRRFVDIRRHLRKLYRDPTQPSSEWRLLRAHDGGIMGVASQNGMTPLRGQGAVRAGARPVAGSRYADWEFVYVPPKPGTGDGKDGG